MRERNVERRDSRDDLEGYSLRETLYRVIYRVSPRLAQSLYAISPPKGKELDALDGRS